MTTGWFQGCLGRISKKWSQAVALYRGSNTNVDSWIAAFIRSQWNFTKGLWKARNEHVNGVTGEEQVGIILQNLHAQVSRHYVSFAADPAYIVLQHHHLFTRRILAQRLQHSYNNITSWLRSVEEAKVVLAHHIYQEQEAAHIFFSTPITRDDHDNSTYFPSTTMSQSASITSVTTISSYKDASTILTTSSPGAFLYSDSLVSTTSITNTIKAPYQQTARSIHSLGFPKLTVVFSL